jgi:hypothetical protein
MRALGIIACVIFGAAGLLYLNYGTVEPCGILRQRIRQQTSRQAGTFGGFLASVTPDSVIDGLVSAQYNRPVTPWLCVNVLLHPEPRRVGS